MVPQATQASYMQSRGFIALTEIEYLICRKCVLSYKLRCHTRIPSPEKSRNNTREKIRYVSRVFDIVNQLLTRYSPLAPLGQVDE